MRCVLCYAKITPEREEQLGVGSPVSCSAHETMVYEIIRGRDISLSALQEGKRQAPLLSVEDRSEQTIKLQHSINGIEGELLQVDPTRTPNIHRILKVQLDAQKNYLLGLKGE